MAGDFCGMALGAVLCVSGNDSSFDLFFFSPDSSVHTALVVDGWGVSDERSEAAGEDDGVAVVEEGDPVSSPCPSGRGPVHHLGLATSQRASGLWGSISLGRQVLSKYDWSGLYSRRIGNQPLSGLVCSQFDSLPLGAVGPK